MLEKYWGKASGRTERGERPEDCAVFHPACRHALDVAAVSMTYLQRNVCLRTSLAEVLQAPPERMLIIWVGFFLALHDLGKFTEAFQSQRPDLMLALRGRAPDPGKPYTTLRHDTLGWLLWKQLLEQQAIEEKWFGSQTIELVESGALDSWMRACTGHHGMPPRTVQGSWKHHCDSVEDAVAIRQFVDALFELFPRAQLAEAGNRLDVDSFAQSSQTFSWWLAGLVVLADWLGSNTDFFPYCNTPMSLGEYWIRAQT